MINDYKLLKKIKSPWRKLMISIAISALGVIGAAFTKLSAPTEKPNRRVNSGVYHWINAANGKH